MAVFLVLAVAVLLPSASQPNPNPKVMAPTVLWNFEALDDGGGNGDNVAFNHSADDSAAFAFVMDPRASLTARSIRSGALKWNVAVTDSDDIYSVVRLGLNTVLALVTANAHVAAKQATALHAYQSGDGTTRWEKRIQQPCDYSDRLLAAARGVVFTTLCHRDPGGVLRNVTLLALSEADGTVLWSKAAPPARTSTDDPIGGFHVANDTVYVLNEQGLTAYDAGTGTQRWQKKNIYP